MHVLRSGSFHPACFPRSPAFESTELGKPILDGRPPDGPLRERKSSLE